MLGQTGDGYRGRAGGMATGRGEAVAGGPAAPGGVGVEGRRRGHVDRSAWPRRASCVGVQGKRRGHGGGGTKAAGYRRAGVTPPRRGAARGRRAWAQPTRAQSAPRGARASSSGHGESYRQVGMRSGAGQATARSRPAPVSECTGVRIHQYTPTSGAAGIRGGAALGRRGRREARPGTARSARGAGTRDVLIGVGRGDKLGPWASRSWRGA
jgi:hypothetical protein